MKTKVKKFKVDATNGLDFSRTIPEFQAYANSIDNDIELPEKLDPATFQIDMSRYYNLVITQQVVELPDDETTDETTTGGLGFGERQTLESSTDEEETSKTPTAFVSEVRTLEIPTDVLRKIILKLTGEKLPRLIGEFAEGQAPQGSSVSANIGYYLDGGLCATWSEVVSA